MKNIPLIVLILVTANTCFSQTTYKRSRKLSPYVTEKYTYTIGTDREIKQGLYQAFYMKKFALASGKYQDDKRVGVWHFLDRKGELIENYNYDTNTLLHEAVEDSTSNFQYLFDYEPKDSDRLTKPIKIGGRYFGYVPYLNLFKIPAGFGEVNLPVYNISLELLISPGGRLAEFKIRLKSPWDERAFNVNIKQLKDEDKIFIPATLNKEPVAARIIISCHVNDDNNIDMD